MISLWCKRLGNAREFYTEAGKPCNECRKTLNDKGRLITIFFEGNKEYSQYFVCVDCYHNKIYLRMLKSSKFKAEYICNPVSFVVEIPEGCTLTPILRTETKHTHAPGIADQ